MFIVWTRWAQYTINTPVRAAISPVLDFRNRWNPLTYTRVRVMFIYASSRVVVFFSLFHRISYSAVGYDGLKTASFKKIPLRIGNILAGFEALGIFMRVTDGARAWRGVNTALVGGCESDGQKVPVTVGYRVCRRPTS